MKIWLSFLLILCGAALLGFQHYIYPQLQGPKRVGQSLVSVQQEQLDPAWQQLQVTAAEISAESDNDIVIKFTYQGRTDHTRLSTCGEVTDKEQSGPWGCQPLLLPAADGSINLRFVLASTSRAIECSDKIAISIYGDDGSVFYRHWFALSKVWHKQPDLWSWYLYKRDGCPARQP